MQKLFFLCLFGVWAIMANAQDKIITVNQDTIDCRIVSVGTEQISYVQKSSDGQSLGRSISVDQVVYYSRKPQPATYRARSWKVERPWLFRANLGGSWMPWLLEDDEGLTGSEKKLAKGFYLNASGHYLFTESLGIGMQYSFFCSKADSDYPAGAGTYLPIYYMLNEKVKQYVNYVGPSIIFRQYLDENKKFQLTETLSGGILFYRYESRISMQAPYSPSEESPSVYSHSTTNSLITGQTVGASLGLSAEYYITPSFSIGIGCDFFYGALKKVDIEQKDSSGYHESLEGGELNDPLKISRIDYSLNMSFRF